MNKFALAMLIMCVACGNSKTADTYEIELANMLKTAEDGAVSNYDDVLYRLDSLGRMVLRAQSEARGKHRRQLQQVLTKIQQTRGGFAEQKKEYEAIILEESQTHLLGKLRKIDDFLKKYPKPLEQQNILKRSDSLLIQLQDSLKMLPMANLQDVKNQLNQLVQFFATAHWVINETIDCDLQEGANKILEALPKLQFAHIPSGRNVIHSIITDLQGFINVAGNYKEQQFNDIKKSIDNQLLMSAQDIENQACVFAQEVQKRNDPPYLRIFPYRCVQVRRLPSSLEYVQATKLYHIRIFYDITTKNIKGTESKTSVITPVQATFEKCKLGKLQIGQASLVTK